MTWESIGLHLVPLMMAAGVMFATAERKVDAAATATMGTTKTGWINDSLNSRTAWYETGCPPLRNVANAHLVYGGWTSTGGPAESTAGLIQGLPTSSSPDTQSSRREGTVATYACDTRYKISSESNSDAEDDVKFTCVPEFITFNMGSYKSRTNVSFVCSKSSTDGHGQWVLLRGNLQNPFYKNPYDGGKHPVGDWRQTKINNLGGKPYPTSVVYNTWSLRESNGLGGTWSRLGRTAEDRFLVLASCFTVLVMFTFVMRGIFRTFCVIERAAAVAAPPHLNHQLHAPNQPLQLAAPAQHQHQQQQQQAAAIVREFVLVRGLQGPPTTTSSRIHIFNEGGELQLPARSNQHHHHHHNQHQHHHLTEDFSLILLPVGKDSLDTNQAALPSYEEATGLPSYADIYNS